MRRSSPRDANPLQLPSCARPPRYRDDGLPPGGRAIQEEARRRARARAWSVPSTGWPSSTRRSSSAAGASRTGRSASGGHTGCTTAGRPRSSADREEIDLVHVWPAGAVETLTAARELGVPTVREVPNTHTQFAFEAVEQENRRLGLEPEPGHSHTFTPEVLEREEAEYRLADALLVPSEFSRRTFLERGLPPGKLVLHRYGCDPARFSPPVEPQRATREGLRALFVGSCEPRKGLHHALRAWMDSGAAERGTFLVCGDFVPGYREALEPLISHPSVEVRSFVDDPAEAMRTSLVPSIEEGSALVTYEAQACGCVLLVSDAAGPGARTGDTRSCTLQETPRLSPTTSACSTRTGGFSRGCGGPPSPTATG